MNKKLLGLTAILVSTIALSGCLNKELSVVNGNFGIDLGQNAGTLQVKGYNDELTELSVVAPSPNTMFSSYNVGVNKKGKVDRITAIGAVENENDCRIKKENLFNELRTQHRDIYLGAGKANDQSSFVEFNNATITVSCYHDLTLEYKLK